MILHDNQDDFKDLIVLTAEYLKIPEVFVEKDYWVTYLLYNLANSDYSNDVVFKGGTSLSKAYNIIDRFSEDVDLVISNFESRKKNQNRKLLSKIPKIIALEPLVHLGDTHPDFRDSFGYKKRVYSYEKINLDEASDYGHARPELILEVNFFFTPFPIKRLKINTYILDYILNNITKEEQDSIIQDFNLESFEVNVLCTSRTFFEKLLSLYRGYHKSVDILKSRIRHFYDIHMLVLRDDEVKNIMKNKNILIKGINDVISDEKQHEMFCDIEEFLPLYKSKFSKDLKSLKKELEQSYNDFSSMVYNKSNLPNFNEVFKTIEELNAFIVDNKI